jgi:hypothetical protein
MEHKERVIMPPTVAGRDTRATTVRIPRSLYDQARHFVDTGKASGSASVSLNDFFVTAIQAYVKLHQRRQIDAAFATMAEDADYQKESSLLSEEFASSDWEALCLIADREEELESATSPAR